MNKIMRLKWWCFALISLLIESCNPKINTKPLNILWLTCEDISPMLACYGDSTANTPVLDKLAAESMVFTNVYATVGVCAPSRSSLITGMYPVSIGTMHMRTGRDYAGWGTRDYSQKSEAKDINGDAIPLYSAVIPEYAKCFTEYLRAKGYYCTNNAKTDYQFAAPVTAWDANSYEAHWKNAPDVRPFFSVFNHEITHESRMWINKNLPQTVKPEEVPLPDYFPDNPIVRQDVARCYSNIELLDKQIGEKLKELKDAGLLDNTIIFFFSDHGGPLPRGKREHLDSGLKVPFMIRFPNGQYAGKNDTLISFVDLAPTVLSLAGIKPPDYMQGKAFLGEYKTDVPRKFVFGSGDRFDEFTDQIRSVRDDRFMYVKNFYPELPRYKDVGYRKNMDMMNELLRLNRANELNEKQALWFEKIKPKEELYDCKNDPFQLVNIAGDSCFLEKLTDLRKALNDWQKEIDDKGNIPEKQLFEQMWPGGVQPKTNIAKIEIKNRKVYLSCNTPGASIGYLVSNTAITPNLDSGWQLYTKPFTLKNDEILYTLACRIGYADSDIVSSNL